jgi:hypothetical protein
MVDTREMHCVEGGAGGDYAVSKTDAISEALADKVSKGACMLLTKVRKTQAKWYLKALRDGRWGKAFQETPNSSEQRIPTVKRAATGLYGTCRG